MPFPCFFLRLEKESAILYIMSREKKAVKKPKTKKKTDYYDYSLLAVIILLTCFGLVILYSTSSYMAELNYGDDMYYFKKQAAISFGLHYHSTWNFADRLSYSDEIYRGALRNGSHFDDAG